MELLEKELISHYMLLLSNGKFLSRLIQILIELYTTTIKFRQKWNENYIRCLQEVIENWEIISREIIPNGLFATYL